MRRWLWTPARRSPASSSSPTAQKTPGDLERALRAARDARLPVHWIPVGRPLPETRISEVLAPDRAFAGQTIQIAVQLAGRFDRPLRVKATTRGASGETQAANGDVDGSGRATIELDASRNGAVLVDVALEDPVSGQTLGSLPDAAVVDMIPRAAILYAQGSSGALARSLRKGGWTLDVVPASRLDAHADGLDGYHAVVLDDVAITDAGPRFWKALVAAVQNRGLGLDGAGRRALVCPRRISGFHARVGAARDVGAGSARSARQHHVRRRQVGQHGPGQWRRGSLSAGPACSARDRARSHRRAIRWASWSSTWRRAC